MESHQKAQEAARQPKNGNTKDRNQQ